MGDAEVSPIASLEEAYTRLIFETIPDLHTPGKLPIEGQLVVLDTSGPIPALRSNPSPVPDGTIEPEEIRGMVAEIIEGVIEDIAATAEGPPNVELIATAARTIREKMAVDGIPPGVLRWARPSRSQPLQESVMHPRLLRELRADNVAGWHVVPEYLKRALALAQGVHSFTPLVNEVLVATIELPCEEITPERLELMQMRALPFCALGVLRGIAIWFELGTACFEYSTLQSNERQLVETLGNMFSTAVIDVFTALFMSNVAQLTTLADAGDSRAIVQEALDYLYPNVGLALIPLEAPTLTVDEPETITIRLRNDVVRQFLGFSGATWRLVYPRPAASRFYHSAPPDQAYHQLIEAKLQDLAIKAASEMDRQYGRLLGVFGHHSGSLFKASGAFHVWSACNRGETPSRHETKQMLDKLLPVWGISQAISLIQKVDTSTGLTVPADWVDRQWLSRDDLGHEAALAIKALITYVFENATQDPPFLEWVVQDHRGAFHTLQWKNDVDARVSGLCSLPPFADDPIIFDKTLAVTIGLFEMANNLRKYPPMRGWGRSVRKALGRLSPVERMVNVTIDLRVGEIAVCIEQPVLIDADGSIPSSRSLDRIRIFEYQCLRGLVATGEPQVFGETSNPRIVRMRQQWRFHWADLLEVLRRNHHGT